MNCCVSGQISLDTAPNLNKALNLNLILLELSEFRSDLSTHNSLLDHLCKSHTLD